MFGTIVHFGPESEILIFEQPLYEENLNKTPLKALVTETPNKESTIELQRVPAINIPAEIFPLPQNEAVKEFLEKYGKPIAQVGSIPQKGSLLKEALMIAGTIYLGKLILSSSSSEKG